MPLGRVELDALQVVALSVLLELLEAFAIPRLQVRRLEDADVDVALLEHVLDEVLLGVLLELLKRPVRLRRPEALIGMEALDPPLRVLLLALHPVRRTRVPEMDVTIDNEVLLTIPLVHMSSLTRLLDDQSQCTPRRPCSRVPASLESGIEARGLSALELGESHQRAMFPDGALDRRCPGALGDRRPHRRSAG